MKGRKERQATHAKNERQWAMGFIQADKDAPEEVAEQESKVELPPWVKDLEEVFEDPGVLDAKGRVTHKIALKEGAKVYQKAPYRMAPNQQETLKEELTEFLRKGWICPSQSEWATVALVVPKKDGKGRVCIDFRDLNAISQLDAYPLPKIDELLHKLAGARWYTKIDLKSGFHQIPMEEGSKKYTAFRTPMPVEGCSLFEWNVMPMGLATAPATFQRWMDSSLRGLENIVLVYLDDVLVYSKEEEQHKQDVRAVLERFRRLKMKAKLDKCEFHKQTVAFLGHVVGEGQIQVDETKLSRLDEWEPPLTSIKQVRQFMGFLSYYQSVYSQFCYADSSHHRYAQEDPKMGMDRGATVAMKEGKEAMWNACKRYAWDPQREDRVTTDASNVGIGAVFEQLVEGVGWAPVAFWSRKLSEAETRYSTTDQEWLAVVEAVTKQWRHWLKGRKFVLRSDHGALKQLLTTKGEDFSNRQYRWFEKLADYFFEFQHLPGSDNAAADALSRAPTHFISALELSAVAQQHQQLGREELKEAAKKDDEYKQLSQKVSKGEDNRWIVEDKLLLDDEEAGARTQPSRNSEPRSSWRHTSHLFAGTWE